MEIQGLGIRPVRRPYAGVIATRERYVRSLPPGAWSGRPPTPRAAAALPDTGHPRAAYPPRKGHVEHLHQPGAVRPDGQHLHDCVRQGRLAESWPATTWPRRTTLPPGLNLQFSGPFFNEFVVTLGPGEADGRLQALRENKILAGLDLRPFYPGTRRGAVAVRDRSARQATD